MIRNNIMKIRGHLRKRNKENFNPKRRTYKINPAEVELVRLDEQDQETEEILFLKSGRAIRVTEKI